MQMTEVEIESGVREADGYGRFRTPHRFERLVTREICDSCNRGWMSQLEKDFLSVVGRLIEPNWPEDAADVIRESLQRSDVIGRWAVKTAITASLAGVLGHRIPQEIADDLRRSKLPEQFFIKLGHIREHSFNLLISAGFKFADEREKWKVSESGRAFDAVFQLNHLAIRAINAPAVEIGFEPSNGAIPISAYPKSNDARKYSFASFEDFEQRLFVRASRTKLQQG
jgi:hypothetical protein